MCLELENHLHLHLLASELFSNQGQVSESLDSDDCLFHCLKQEHFPNNIVDPYIV